MKPISLTDLICPCDPHGNLIFTCLSTNEKDAIEFFLHTEHNSEELANLFRATRGENKVWPKSWEQYEAEGYSLVRVSLKPEPLTETGSPPDGGQYGSPQIP